MKIDEKKKISGAIWIDLKNWMWKIEVDQAKMSEYSEKSDPILLRSDIAALTEIYNISQINPSYASHSGVAAIQYDLSMLPHRIIKEKSVPTLVAYPVMFKGNFQFMSEKQKDPISQEEHIYVNINLLKNDTEIEIGKVYAILDKDEKIIGLAKEEDVFPIKIL
ncbi:MAG: hypothetical protein ACUVXA_06755 [Candidatus Jordarchaeum sp.]|uniref:hypothetical protein n=1 Tax=Candidatus Jordarchaeum sp. TaxID=2823881 RepID=UPI004049974F